MKLSSFTHRLRRNDVSFLVFIEPCHTLDGHVISLRSTRSEDNVFGLCTNKICYMLENVSGVPLCS